MSRASIRLKRWAAWMPGVHTHADWVAWASGTQPIVSDDKPNVSEIPPMLRRRLSSLGKMALSVAWPLVSEGQFLPSVFCSRHGELERTVGLLNNLVDEEPLSPTHFSLSVHNAIGGVFSIARRDKSPISALAVGDEGVSQALLEAHLILQDGDFDDLLCVIYDAPLPDPYPRSGFAPNHPYAAAFVLTKQLDAETISLDLGLESRAEQNPDDGGAETDLHVLEFLRFLLTPTATPLRLPGRRHQWRWQKTPEAA